MTLLLTEEDVKLILKMPMALDAVQDSFRRLQDGLALVHFRQRLHVPGKGYMNYMAAADVAGGYMGLKVYSTTRTGARFLVVLFKVDTGECAALIEADYLGQMRTGAASGVATRFLARDDACIAGIIGTGWQARAQLEAIALVRKLSHVRAHSRDEQRREQFAKEMSALLGIPVAAVASCEEAVRDADVVITSTTSKNPVVEGRWLKPGMHINAIGVNLAFKRELDAEAVLRCDVVVADSREQSKIEAGDLIQAFGEDKSKWESVHELGQIVSGGIPGRTNAAQITLFKSTGVATEDVVVAGRIYEIARERKVGKEVAMWAT